MKKKIAFKPPKDIKLTQTKLHMYSLVEAAFPYLSMGVLSAQCTSNCRLNSGGILVECNKSAVRFSFFPAVPTLSGSSDGFKEQVSHKTPGGP